MGLVSPCHAGEGFKTRRARGAGLAPAHRQLLFWAKNCLSWWFPSTCPAAYPAVGFAQPSPLHLLGPLLLGAGVGVPDAGAAPPPRSPGWVANRKRIYFIFCLNKNIPPTPTPISISGRGH